MPQTLGFGTQHYYPGNNPRLNKTVFPVSENTSDRDKNVPLCATCVKGQLWILSGPDSSEIVRSSYDKTAFVLKREKEMHYLYPLTNLCLDLDCGPLKLPIRT